MIGFKEYFINEAKKEPKKYQPKSNKELKELVRDESIYLGDIDVSKIDDFSEIFAFFKRKDFSGIETWDMSKATNMRSMFSNNENFNHNINNWDVSKVTRLDSCFYGCKNFNQPLDKWNVSNVRTMEYTFYNCKSFNQPLNNWDVSRCILFQSTFDGAESFNQPLNKWKMDNVLSASKMFEDAKSFNQDISMWNTSKWDSFRHMFYGSGCELKNQPFLKPYYWRGRLISANKTFPATEKQIEYAEYLAKATQIELPDDYENDKYELTKWIDKAKKELEWMKKRVPDVVWRNIQSYKRG